MALTEKTTHVTEAIANLVEQFKSKLKLNFLLQSYIEEIQDLEVALFEVLEERGIATSIGAQLDGLGSIVGEERLGRSDDDYRTAIIARIGINVGSGTPEDIIGYLTLVAAGSDIELEEFFPASLTARVVDALTADEATVIGNLLKEIKAAGVGIDLVYGISSDALLKKFDLTVSANQTFDQGKFSGVI